MHVCGHAACAAGRHKALMAPYGAVMCGASCLAPSKAPTVCRYVSHFPHSAKLVPGDYSITRTVGVAHSVDFSMDDFTTLAEGTAVHVVEVVRRDDQGRVRGRIDRPVAGWISLENLDDGSRWVRPGLVWHAQHMQRAIWHHQ